MKAIDVMELQDRRRMWADALTAAVMEELRDVLEGVEYDPSPERLHDLRRDIHYRLHEVFYRNGASIMTDEERAKEGLEPRDAKGWTVSERVAIQQAHQEVLYKMANLVVIPKP